MKVLTVDDSRLLQKRLVESLLEVDDGMKIFQAFSFEEAIELFISTAPEIVILDVELPDGSGINLLRKFKKERPDVEVIIFTSHSTNEFRKSCKDLEARDFIDKSDFLSLIDTVVSLKYSRVYAVVNRRQTKEQNKIK